MNHGIRVGRTAPNADGVRNRGGKRCQPGQMRSLYGSTRPFGGIGTSSISKQRAKKLRRAASKVFSRWVDRPRRRCPASLLYMDRRSTVIFDPLTRPVALEIILLTRTGSSSRHASTAHQAWSRKPAHPGEPPKQSANARGQLG